jgi:hypothetical protein
MAAFLNQQKTCAFCGETWNDCLVDHTCKALLGVARFVIDEGVLSNEQAQRLARAVLQVEELAFEAVQSSEPGDDEHNLASSIMGVLEDG